MNPQSKRRTIALLIATLLADAGVIFLPVTASAQAVSSQNASKPSTLTITTHVRQVLFDVVVTDRNNRLVSGLRREDFSVSEDGKPQKIVFFEEHGTAARSVAPNVPGPALPPDTFTNIPLGNDDQPLIVVLYDLLNTPIEDLPFAHQQLAKFLHHRRAGSRIAIFVLSSKLYLLHGFADDQRQVLTAVDRAGGVPLPAWDTATGTASTAAERIASRYAFVDGPAARSLLADVQGVEDRFKRDLVAERVWRTWEAFNEIAAFLNGLPGRKDLIWMAGSFPAQLLPSGTLEAPLSYARELRDTTNSLAVSRVAVYPVDVRGLVTDPIFSAAFAPSAPREVDAAHRSWLFEMAKDEELMDVVARETGGRAFYNTNGLAQAIAAATEQGAHYYTLSYTPTNTNFDGKVRNIQVTFAKPGYHLSYRRHYVADKETVASETKPLRQQAERLQVALRRGAPLMNELQFEVHAAPAGAPTKAKPEAVKVLAKFPAYHSRKKWDDVRLQSYILDYTLPKEFAPADTDPARHRKMELLLAAYDSEDRTLYGQDLFVEPANSSKQREENQGDAYHVRQVMTVPTSTAWVRVTVRDVTTDRIGSIEIPLPLPER